MANKKGMLMVLSGPSGCGKGTVVKKLLSRYPDMVLSVSMTTRDPRDEDVDGVTYHFVTKEEFEAAIAANGFLEYANYSGNYYGTPLAPVKKWLEEGKCVILEIEVQGGEKVMDNWPDPLTVFLDIPSMEELERRLRGRDTEDEESIQKRLKAAEYELSRMFRYQYVVLNDEVEAACDRIRTIIDAESLRYHRVKE